MSELTAFGELLIDLFGNQNGTLDQVTSFIKRPGGAPANVAVGGARLGLETALVASVGQDPFGNQLIDYIENEGVDTNQIHRSERRTTLSFVSLDQENQPDFLFYRDHCADVDVRKEQVHLDRIEQTDIFHFGSLSLTNEPIRSTLLYILEQIETPTVSFDPNLRSDLISTELIEQILDILEHVHLLLLAEEELTKLTTGDTDQERARNLLTSYDLNQVVVTRGADGASCYDTKTERHIDAHPADVVDTTGAGDGFTAGYLTAFARQLSIGECLRYGTITGAFCTEETGAMEALPTLKQVNERMTRDQQ